MSNFHESIKETFEPIIDSCSPKELKVLIAFLKYKLLLKKLEKETKMQNLLDEDDVVKEEKVETLKEDDVITYEEEQALYDDIDNDPEVERVNKEITSDFPKAKKAEETSEEKKVGDAGEENLPFPCINPNPGCQCGDHSKKSETLTIHYSARGAFPFEWCECPHERRSNTDPEFKIFTAERLVNDLSASLNRDIFFYEQNEMGFIGVVDGEIQQLNSKFCNTLTFLDLKLSFEKWGQWMAYKY